MEKFKEFLITLVLLIIGSIVVATGLIMCAISMDKVLVDFTTIKDVISQEYVIETNLKVKDLKISKSELSITIDNDGVFNTNSLKESDIQGSFDVEYTLSDDSTFTKTFELKDIHNTPDIGSTVSTQYYKGIYEKITYDKTQTIKSQNKLQKGDKLAEDLIEPIYNWETINKRKEPIKTTIKITYQKPNGYFNKLDVVTSEYTIKP